MFSTSSQSASAAAMEPASGTLPRMLSDVLRLAAHAVETGRLPERVSLADLYQMHLTVSGDGVLNEQDVERLGLYYTALQGELAPITAVSLGATDCTDIRNCMKTQAGWHARRVWVLAFLVVVLITALNLARYTYEFYSAQWAKTWPDGLAVMTFIYWLSVNLAPFTYGALGACVHILRVTERHLRLRTFDPRRVPQHRNRLVLGTLSGGIIVLFVTTGEGANTTLELTAAAMGFLAGYSVEFLFAILDRILSAMVPARSDLDRRQQSRSDSAVPEEAESPTDPGEPDSNRWPVHSQPPRARTG